MTPPRRDRRSREHVVAVERQLAEILARREAGGFITAADAPQPDARRPTAWKEFSQAWWSQAWVRSLEANATVDPNRLGRGRTYARKGMVRSLEIEPGGVDALVAGSRPRPYSVTVTLATFGPNEWNTLLDAVAARAAHAAALLEGDLTPEIVEDVRSVGLDLLPTGRDLRLACSCPDWAVPCKHAAAVCYEVARRLDDDPFLLLLLRGRTREQVLAALRERRRGAGRGSHEEEGDRARQQVRGMPARDAWQRSASASASGTALGTRGAELDEVRMALGSVLAPVPRSVGRPPPLAADPPANSGLSAEGLDQLRSDAAERAWALLAGLGGVGATDATEAERGSAERLVEIARRVALAGDVEQGAVNAVRERLIAEAGLPRDRVLALARSWLAGGDGGVRVMVDDWQPAPEDLDAGREALAAVIDARVTARGHRVTPARGGGAHLRVGRDGNWFRVEREGRQWEVVDGPAVDPTTLLGDAVARERPTLR